MPQRNAFLRMALLPFAAWAITLLLYFVAIVVVATVFQRAPASTTSAAVVVLIAVEIIGACLAVAFVISRSRGLFGAAMRAIWIAVFAALQLATVALAVLVSLVALNR